MMKFKTLFLWIAIIAIPLKSLTQEKTPIKRCSSTEYLKEQLLNNPSLQSKRDSIEHVMQQWIDVNRNTLERSTVITIPVVVHVVYNSNVENVSDERIYEQIDALNRDYRMLNPDGANVPAEFQLNRADTKIEFCLAKRDPNNNATTGIERRHTSETSFPVSLASGVKFYSQGGLDAWNSSKYLNIWVCNLIGNNLGFAQFPGGSPETDGLVVDYEYFGITGTTAPFNMGRTSVHEIGHCFNLIHIWGDVNDCSGTDYCNDTPNQETYNFYCPSFPLTDNCTSYAPGVMFMNYLDYVDDDCMVMFTNDQAARIQACLNTVRLELKLSDGCIPIGIDEVESTKSLHIHPNPASQNITIEIPGIVATDVSIRIIDTFGKIVLQQQIANFSEKTDIQINNLNRGVYFVQVISKEFNFTEKVIIQHNKNR